VIAVARQCEDRDARGQRLMWNHYRVFLSREDFDGMAPLVSMLQRDLGEVLREELAKHEAQLVGGLDVDLLVGEGRELPQGTATVQVAFRPWVASDAAAGPVTVRLGRHAAPPPVEPTQRVVEPGAAGAGVRVTWPGGTALVGAGTRVVFGRPHQGAKGSFVALSGASNEINRRQLFVEPTGDGVLVGRVSDANAVQVNGRLIQAGGQIAVSELPLEISLSSGALVLRVEAT
jgi:hypothetical protein